MGTKKDMTLNHYINSIKDEIGWRGPEKREEKRLENNRLKFVDKTFRLPNGEEQKCLVRTGYNGVCAIAITTDNKVVCVMEYRPGPEKIFLDLPGGHLEEGEDEVEGIVRELQEETSYSCSKENVVYLGTEHIHQYDESIKHGFLITGCKLNTNSNLKPDHNEFLKVVCLPMDEFVHHVLLGKMFNTSMCLKALVRLGWNLTKSSSMK